MKNFCIGLIVTAAMMTGLVFAADVGSSSDVAAVRAAAHQKYPSNHTSGVHVLGNYALIDWYGGEASGYAAFKRASGARWTVIDFGGGATDVSDLVQHGVPSSVAARLCRGWGSSSPC